MHPVAEILSKTLFPLGQMPGCFEAVLNGYLRKENIDVFVTGSNAKLLSKDIATEFAGRGDEIPMFPLSFAEFMTVYTGDKYMGLSEYMLHSIGLFAAE